MDRELPKDLDFSKGVENLVIHRGWILDWNRDFFSKPENNVNECIKKVERDRQNYLDLNTDVASLVSICDFRLEILGIVKEEMESKILRN